MKEYSLDQLWGYLGESVKWWPDNGLQVIGVSVVCLNQPRGALEAWIAALVLGKLYLSWQGKSIVSQWGEKPPTAAPSCQKRRRGWGGPPPGPGICTVSARVYIYRHHAAHRDLLRRREDPGKRTRPASGLQPRHTQLHPPVPQKVDPTARPRYNHRSRHAPGLDLLLPPPPRLPNPHRSHLAPTRCQHAAYARWACRALAALWSMRTARTSRVNCTRTTSPLPATRWSVMTTRRHRRYTRLTRTPVA